MKSLGLETPLAFLQVSMRPDWLEHPGDIDQQHTSLAREARAEGIQSTITSAPLPAITCAGAMSGPPGLMSYVQTFSLK